MYNINQKSDIIAITPKSSEERKDIAYEVYLAKNFVKFRYREHWKKEVSDALQNKKKNSLSSYLTDKRKNKDGAITLYLEDNPDHFDNDGKWIASKFMEALKYICRKLVEDNFMSEKNQEIYLQGFRYHDQWIKNVISHTLDYVTERIYKNKALKSNYLSQKIDVNLDKTSCLNELHSAFEKLEEKQKDEVQEIFETKIDRLENTIFEDKVNLENNYPRELACSEEFKHEIEQSYRTEKEYLVDDQVKISG